MYGWYGAQRLRESEINYVFCEWVLYVCTAPEQKTKSAKKRQGLDVLAVFLIHPSATSCTHRLASRLGRCFCTKVQRSPPETRTLCKGGKKVYLLYLARFSRFIKVYYFSAYLFSPYQLYIERIFSPTCSS